MPPPPLIPALKSMTRLEGSVLVKLWLLLREIVVVVVIASPDQVGRRD